MLSNLSQRLSCIAKDEDTTLKASELNLLDWIGNSEQSTDRIDSALTQRIAITLRDQPESPQPRNFASLPPLWHWCFFQNPAPLSRTNIDGHPHHGSFLPPIRLPRRMWAGGSLKFLTPLPIDSEVMRHSKIKSIETKQGRSGELIFISIEHTYWLEGVAAMYEQQDLVFREPAKPGTLETPSSTETEKRNCIAYREIEPSSVLLFRYSALTFNSHRIHYDRDYAIDSEGYEGLVVHGPLLATQLIEFAQKHNEKKQRLVGFTFRAMRPVSDKHNYKLCIGEIEGSSLPLWIENHEGAVAMKATAILESD